MTLKETLLKHLASRKIFVTLVTMLGVCGLGLAAGISTHLTEVLFALMTAGGFHAAGHALADKVAAAAGAKDAPKPPGS